MIDQLKSLDIGKGKPFNPDAPTKALMTQAAQEAHAWLSAKYEAGWQPFFAGTRWRDVSVDRRFVSD